MNLRLTGRSSSHFTRVTRIVAHELGVTVELEIVRDLMGHDAAAFGGHPALKLPTLHVDGRPLFGTDNICRRLAELAGRGDDARVLLSHQVTSDLLRNAQELVWHAMSAQVQLVVGLRLAQLPADNPFFSKARAGMVGALTWLDQHLDAILVELPSPRDLSILEVTLFCLVEHMIFRPTIPLEPFRHLRDFATAFAARRSSQLTPFVFDA